MSDAIARAIDELETRRARLLAEYQEIEEALAAMRRIGTNGDDAAATSEKARKAARPMPGRGELAEGLVHHNRDQERPARILAFLVAGPQPTRVIAQKLGQDRKVTKQALQRLKRGGHLIAIGHARTARWALPTKRPAASTAPAASATREGP
jgi:hypothetical protein